jgi:hypothetical protein
MNTILLSLALSFLKWWISSGVFTRIVELVDKMASANMTGEDKRLYVITAMKAEYSMLSTTGIAAVIEMYLLNQKQA